MNWGDMGDARRGDDAAEGRTALSQRDTPIDTLRLNPAQREALLNQLNDNSGAPGDEENGRRHTRVGFTAESVAITFIHPGGIETSCLITPRNLSVAGLGFLHGGFIHQNTECYIELPTLFGDTMRVRGRVRSCRHIKGRVHEIGLEFSSEIDPYEFLEPGDAPTSGDSHDIDPSQFHGSILMVDSSAPDTRLLAHHLRSSNISVEIREDYDAAEEAIASGAFGLIFFGDSALSENGGADYVQGARSQGFDGPVVAMTSESKGDWLAKLRKCGFTDVLVKPYNTGKLFATLSQHLPESGAAGSSSGQIFSMLASDDGVVELLETFLQDVESSIKELHALMGAGALQDVRSACLALKGTGQGYGYPRFSDAAREVVDTIDKTSNTMEIEVALKRLDLVFKRLTPATIARPNSD